MFFFKVRRDESKEKEREITDEDSDNEKDEYSITSDQILDEQIDENQYFIQPKKFMNCIKQIRNN